MKSVVKNPRVVARRHKGRCYLVPVSEEMGDMRKVFELNELGWFIWQSLEEAEDPEDLAGLIMESFEVDRDTAIKDAGAFLNELLRVGALMEGREGDQEA